MAADARLGPEGPPLRYPVDGVSVAIRQLPGSVRGAQTRRLVLPGAGRATLTRGEAVASFDYAAADLMGVLNTLYRMRFFDLPTDLVARYSVYLNDDGVVGTSHMRLLDRASTEVCVRLADYEKCVRYADGEPAALDALVRQLNAEADQRVAAARTK
ncbi:hypothetical protein O4G98_05070 [Zoogloeaceae bacterium G21618-S1]|nr:hypothetical protein [Zoogloeaceae bacterium G21618-S1]